MCNPIAAGLVVTLAATAYQAYDQDQTVRAQNKINEQAQKEGQDLATESFKQQAGQVRLRDQQEAAAASQEQFHNEKAAAGARATARVSAGEAGVAGVSVDNLISDFYGQEAQYRSGVSQNLQWSQAQSSAQLQGIRSNAIDRGIAARRPEINRPSYLATGLTMAQQGFDAYNRYRYDSASPSGRSTE